jgi:hypothetical protein
MRFTILAIIFELLIVVRSLDAWEQAGSCIAARGYQRAPVGWHRPSEKANRAATECYMILSDQ